MSNSEAYGCGRSSTVTLHLLRNCSANFNRGGRFNRSHLGNSLVSNQRWNHLFIISASPDFDLLSPSVRDRDFRGINVFIFILRPWASFNSVSCMCVMVQRGTKHRRNSILLMHCTFIIIICITHLFFKANLIEIGQIHNVLSYLRIAMNWKRFCSPIE